MIRPFDIRDVSILQRLTPHARPLACELVAVDGIAPLREAMRAYMSGGRDHAVVLVERDSKHNLDAFGLMHVLPEQNNHDNHNHHNHAESNPHLRRAALVMMAPHAQSEEMVEAWMYLAQEFASEAAQRGVHHIVAEVPEAGGEAEALHGAGFVPLIPQDVLKLAGRLESLPAPELPAGMREQTKDDEPHIKALHMRVAPKLTYQAELTFDLLRGAHRAEKGIVLERQNELAGHMSVRQGRRGYGMHIQFRQEAEEDAHIMLQYALSRLAQRERLPVYVTVRQYQSWLLPILDGLGFVHMSSTLLMMRHTAARVHQPVWSASPELAAAKKPTSASINLESRASQRSSEDAIMRT
jgi:hypothetical protein